MATPFHLPTRWQHLSIYSIDGSTYPFTHYMVAPNNLLTRWQHQFIIPSDLSISTFSHQMAAPLNSTRWLYLFSTKLRHYFSIRLHHLLFSHKAAPIFLPDGRDIFTRWDHLNICDATLNLRNGFPSGC